MQITASQVIAGYPAIKARDFLRKHLLTGLSAERIQSSLSVSPQDARGFLSKLLDTGLIKESRMHDGHSFFDLTDYGVRLAYASASKPIYRETADRLLSDFMERVHTVNATAEYLFWVSEAILFGSMLSDVEQLSDVDVAVTLESKAKDFTEFCEWSWERRRAAEVKGRSFPTIVDQAYWPKLEVCLQLKAKSNALKLSELSHVERLPNLAYRVLLGDPERIAARMPTGRVVPNVATGRLTGGVSKSKIVA